MLVNVQVIVIDLVAWSWPGTAGLPTPPTAGVSSAQLVAYPRDCRRYSVFVYPTTGRMPTLIMEMEGSQRVPMALESQKLSALSRVWQAT